MAPKRRAAKRKSAVVEPEPVIEVQAEPEKVPEPEMVDEPVSTNEVDQVVAEAEAEAVADTNDEDIQVEEDAEPEPKKEMTLEEKLAELDSLSKAHPSALMYSLVRKTNRPGPTFIIKKNESNDDEVKQEDPSEESLSVTVRFGALKICVPNVPGQNFRKARKVSTDLVLKQLYGEEHELDTDTVEVQTLNEGKIEEEEDQAWADEKMAEFLTNKREWVDKILKKIEASNKYSDEVKATKSKDIESKLVQQELPSYDELYKTFDYPYYRALHNACVMRKLSYETKIYRFEDEKEVEIPAAEQEQLIESQTQSKFKISVMISKKGGENLFELEHLDESCLIREARSEAGYKILEKLLADGTLPRAGRGLVVKKLDRLASAKPFMKNKKKGKKQPKKQPSSVQSSIASDQQKPNAAKGKKNKKGKKGAQPKQEANQAPMLMQSQQMMQPQMQNIMQAQYPAYDPKQMMQWQNNWMGGMVPMMMPNGQMAMMMGGQQLAQQNGQVTGPPKKKSRKVKK